MRLISCDIENFGKLSGVHMDFQPGINYIYGENGWGKSTLAAFIRVMFYGLENDGKRDKLERDRSRYMPWQGGAFGGRLTFSMDNREYIIERSFGAKASEDTLVVREGASNLETGLLGAVPGETVFGLDAVSFANSVYVGDNCCSARLTGTIMNRLGQESMEYQDLGLYDYAEARLHDYLNKQSPDRATGALNKDKKKLADMEYRMSFKEGYEKIKQDKNDLYSEKKLRLEELKAKRKKLGQESRSKAKKAGAAAGGRELLQVKRPGEGVRLILAVLCLGLWLAAGAVYYLRQDIVLTIILAGAGLLSLIIRIIYSRGRSSLTEEDAESEEELDFIEEELDRLDAAIDGLRIELSGLEGDLKDADRSIQEIEDISRAYAGLKEDYEEGLQAYADAKLCQELLNQANQKLMQRYTGPLKTSFVSFYNVMTGAGGEKLTLDVKGNIGWLEAGAQRDVRSLSTGYQDIIGLCSRMAYVDIMYQQELPMLVMDDPFIHLDDKNKEGAERLLLDLGKRYQVIYLSCSQGL